VVSAVIRIERHPLGPRVFLVGLRVHEVAIGLVLLALLVGGGFAEIWELSRRTEAAGAVGSWLVAKDWRDLFPSRRNTARWSLLLHRVPRGHR
jgi:hypothetical protein